MNFYEKFKQDTPQLSFKNEDIIDVEFTLDTYHRWDSGEEETERHHEAISSAIEKLKEDQKIAPELSYLIDFLEKYLKAENDTFKVQVDLEKLKYCKTLIAYIGEEYTEEVLALLDYLQDDLVDTLEIDENRVFFLPTTQSFCVVREDLQEQELGVPLAEGETYYYDSEPLQYRWKDDGDDVFEVLYQGQWLEAYSIDFDFPFEHLKVE